ncbi:hypothetical protein JCM11641_005057 [Rhodosporidiobolus odoratus]
MVNIPSLLPRVRTFSNALTAALPSSSPLSPKDEGGRGFVKFSSGLDFKDASALPYAAVDPLSSFAVRLTPPPSQLEMLANGTKGGLAVPSPVMSRSGSPGGSSMSSVGTIKRQNEGEQKRLQGLMRSDTVASRRSSMRAAVEKKGRWEGTKAWMVNEGAGRIAFAIFVFVQALVFAFGFVNYALKDNLVTARRNFGVTYMIARSAALVLHVDVALVLLPVCRNFISLLRRGPLNWVVPFEKNIVFHKAVAWSIVFFTVVHSVAHLFNAWWMGEMATSSTGGRFVMALEVNFTTGPGITGWIMVLCLAIMVFFAADRRKRRYFERFWFSHHLFIPFFIAWQLHGMFCLIKPDRPPFCDPRQIGVFWKYWLVGGVIYIFERVLREVRSRHRTWIHKVILHPSNVLELQIKKEKTRTRAGQFIFINVPSLSYFQFHPFTLTSAPEEDHIGVHIRIVGDWTRSLAEALGCDLPPKGETSATDVGAEVVHPAVGRALPRIMVDGPFGSASEDVLKYEVSVLVGAGIGVTPFASLLKHIWYRCTYPNGTRTTLNKVYFFWVCRDYGSFEWFQSLLLALEAQDLDNHIEIHTYMTGRVKEPDMHNIFANDVGGEVDALTRLRAPTHYGRPNWDRIFASIAASHPDTDVGSFFCGPKALGSTLHKMCNKYTSAMEGGTRFFWGKENF